ncbi:MAG: hypothetical protein HY703_13545 [Gemmatimonadetes bacterium]|nr:hypothetical protein [Gemmatimonadota bacterium]
MSAAARVQSGSPPLLVDLIELIPRPSSFFPVLFRRAEYEALPELVFSASAGVFVAYHAARWVALGERLGFATAALIVLLVGAVLGLVALYFAGGLLSWSADALEGEGNTERMYAVFGYSSWLFLPLLAVVVPTELAFYGTAALSAVRPEAPALAVWGIRALELATLAMWAMLVTRGTAVAARLADVKAAEVIALSLIEIGGIALLLLVIVILSFMY